MININIDAGLAIYDRFTALGREVAKLPALLLPQYRNAALALYEVCQLLLEANENLARWLLEFRYFDFRQRNAKTKFAELVKDYQRMKSGPRYRELKFRCGDIAAIYHQEIASKMGRWFSDKRKLEEAQGVFTALGDADGEMVRFVYDQVMVEVNRIAKELDKLVETGALDQAEEARLRFKADSADLVESLERFGGELSDLVLEFARAAHVPVTLRRPA